MAGLRLLLVALVAGLLTGCGGGGDSASSTATVPESAAVTPADVAFYVSVDTDFDGEQWQRLERLLDKFPSGDELGRELREELASEDVDWERDLKPALGPEVAVMGWELDGEEPQFVMITRSPQPAKLRELLEQSDEPAVTSEVGGWTVAAERQADLDRFTTGQAAAKLEGQEPFTKGLEQVGEDALAIAYVGGPELERAVSEGATEEGLPPGLTKSFGTLQAIVFGASAQEDGVRFGAVFDSEDGPKLESYSPSLDELLPAKPLLYVSAANVDDLARSALGAAEQDPGAQRQLKEAETLFGLSIEDDVLPLLDGELALAVYAGGTGPLPVTVDLVAKVDDEDEARRVLDRISALAEVGAGGELRKTKVGDLDATELRIEGMSIFWAVWDGKMAITTGREALEALRAGTPRLADDDAYSDALEQAGAPDEVVGLVYSDLDAAIPLVTGIAPSRADAETAANLEPLRSALLYGTADGGDATVSGFLAVD